MYDYKLCALMSRGSSIYSKFQANNIMIILEQYVGANYPERKKERDREGANMFECGATELIQTSFKSIICLFFTYQK